MKPIIKKGKSRKVEIFYDFVIKNSILKNNQLIRNIRLNKDGEFENLKEKYLNDYTIRIKQISKSFAKITQFNINTTEIIVEKLEPVDPYKFKIFQKLLNQINYYLSDEDSIDNVFDNHTLDNKDNYGIDIDGNLKLLDYAPIEIYLNSNYTDDKNKVDTIKNNIKTDIIQKNYSEISKYYKNIFIFSIILESYNSNIRFVLFKLWLKNILTIKDIFDYYKTTNEKS